MGRWSAQPSSINLSGARITAMRSWLQIDVAVGGFAFSILVLRWVALGNVVGIILIVALTVAGFVIPSAVRQ